MKNIKRILVALFLFSAGASAAFANDLRSSTLFTPQGSFYTISANMEAGFLKVLGNTITSPLSISRSCSQRRRKHAHGQPEPRPRPDLEAARPLSD